MPSRRPSELTSSTARAPSWQEVQIRDLPNPTEERQTQQQSAEGRPRGKQVQPSEWPGTSLGQQDSQDPSKHPSSASPNPTSPPIGPEIRQVLQPSSGRRSRSAPFTASASEERGGDSPTPATTAPPRFERPKLSSKLKDLPFAARLAAVGNIHIYAKTKRPRDYNIYLSSLQRMVIGQLQKELAEVVREIYFSTCAEKESMDKAKQLLADYTNAIRDYDFMIEKLKQCVEHGEQDPFKISTTRTFEALLMEDARLIPKDQPPSPAEDRTAYERRENILPGVSRSEHQQKSELVKFLERLGMGLGGGIALIVPMLVMVLRDDILTQLLSTTVATMLFAGILSILGKNLKGETVLASVAAYTAVLVVFVGASA